MCVGSEFIFLYRCVRCAAAFVFCSCIYGSICVYQRALPRRVLSIFYVYDSIYVHGHPADFYLRAIMIISASMIPSLVLNFSHMVAPFIHQVCCLLSDTIHATCCYSGVYNDRQQDHNWCNLVRIFFTNFEKKGVS